MAKDRTLPLPYEVHLSPDQAKELVHSGGTVLLMDVPAGTVVGLDQQSFVVGPKFKGIKMLPPGPHFVYYNASGAGSSSDFAPTVSFCVHIAPREVLVRRWDSREELLLPIPDRDEEERYAAAVKRLEFDASLAPCNLAVHPEWRQLSGHITPDVMERHSPVGGNFSVTAEVDPALQVPSTQAEARLAEQLEKRLTTDESGPATELAALPNEARPARDAQQSASSSATTAADTARNVDRCYYTSLPRNVKGAGLSPAQLTALNLDKSMLLESLIAKHYGGRAEDILGELQFAFLAFLLGQSLEGFGQWKALLRLLLSCEKAPLRTRTSFYAQGLTAIHAQLQHCLTSSRGPDMQQPSPLGLPMTEELLADSFLKGLFARFYDMLHVHSAQVAPELQAEASKLQQLLEDRLGWSFSIGELGGDADDEDAPVVVEV